MNNTEFLKGLRYKKFSIIYMHTFGINECNTKLFKGYKEFIKEDDNPIDRQIFAVEGGEKSPVARFKLPSFDVEIKIESEIEESEREQDKDEGFMPYKYDAKIRDIEHITVCGKVFVELSLFFNRTATLTFRLMVNDERDEKGELVAAEKSEEYITTDHLISLVALSMGAEHWNVMKEREKTPSNINLKPAEVRIKNLALDKNLNWLKEGSRLAKLDTDEIFGANNPRTEFDVVFERYRSAILKGQNAIDYKPLNFVYIDVWEDINNYDYTLQESADEAGIIDYIRENCKAELVGLMTLYPKEWPYRESIAFDEVCGSSIAIDVDDFVLLNAGMCVCFGTYARRGKGNPTDWAEISMQRKIYHVSWPEYMLILEMVLAKKYTIGAARKMLLKSLANCATVDATRDNIEKNAKLEMRITEILLKLDAVNYSKFMSHKIMFDRTLKRLDIEKDKAELGSVMEKVDTAQSNLFEMRRIKQSSNLNLFLLSLSIASLLEVLFSEPQMPFFAKLGLEEFGLSMDWGIDMSAKMQSLTFILLCTGLLVLIYNIFWQFCRFIMAAFKPSTYKKFFKKINNLTNQKS